MPSRLITTSRSSSTSAGSAAVLFLLVGMSSGLRLRLVSIPRGEFLVFSLYDSDFEKEFDGNTEFFYFMSLEYRASRNHSFSLGGS